MFFKRALHGRFRRHLAVALTVTVVAGGLSGSATANATRTLDHVAGTMGATAATSLPCAATQQLRDIRVHDPFIMPDPVTGIYYLYQGNTVRRSIDLKHWCAPVTVFTNPQGSWANAAHGTWAPEAWHYNGKYYWFATLHNRDRVLATASTNGQHCGDCGQIWQNQHWRGTVIAAADSPMGPFELLNLDSPVAPSNHMTLDGTLYVDPEGQPWMVYAHEWVQKIDGTIEAIRLERDAAGNLTGRGQGDPIYLFKGSDAPWYYQEGRVDDVQLPPYVTDGPSFYRTYNNELLMFWTSYRKHNNEYVVTLARSKSGDLKGPWTQEDVVIPENKGHSMLFRTFADKQFPQGRIMMSLHNNMNGGSVIRTELYEMREAVKNLVVKKQRTDLDGDPVSHWVWPRQ
ncbi:glycoside hydrolase family 43 protein [Polymorphospora sp. NPDC050346]|uniref:glycoside hydrolase family 43 protein n=1 Tax=Polymorphospora sp. NPDC050346 TaxID=3155780 RepID=UPI00340A0DE8